MEKQRFCAACGAPVTGAFCSKCGTRTRTARRFPLASVILMSVGVVANAIPVFGGFYMTSLVSWLNFLCEGCLALSVLGMIVIKKERNWLVGMAFILFGALRFFSEGIRFLEIMRIFGWDSAMLTSQAVSLVFQWVPCLLELVIGLTYLIAKPSMRIIKLVACVAAMGFLFLCMAVSAVSTRGNGMIVLLGNFLLLSSTVYVAALLYTPYKK